MSRRRAAKLSNQILDEATGWFVEIRERPNDANVRETFYDWVRTSPEHVRAYLQITAHWEEDAVQPGVAFESVDELLKMAKADMNVLPLMLEQQGGWHPGERDGPVAAARDAWSNRVSVWIGYAVAASVLIALVALGGYFYIERGLYATDIGEQRSLRLEDGSTVEINARSRIRVRYTKDERRIDLLEGQALFQVAKNRSRPFIVQSGDVEVRAVGTQFDVYRKRNGTIVTVVEGQVAIHAGGSQSDSIESARRELTMRVEGKIAGRGLLLAAGEQLTLHSSTTPKPEPADVVAATAWTQRRLVFVGTPLSEVVEEFNRYNARPLMITDSSIAATEISGSFSSSEPASLLRFLREVGTYAIRETDSTTEISRR
jgi:transmembrane sensor